MDLPRGRRLKHGSLYDFSKICSEMPEGFNGALSFFVKFKNRFYAGSFLLKEGSIIALSVEDVETHAEKIKDEAMAWVREKLFVSTGDLELISFSDTDMRLILSHNMYAFLGEELELARFVGEMGLLCERGKEEAQKAAEEAHRVEEEHKEVINRLIDLVDEKGEIKLKDLVRELDIDRSLVNRWCESLGKRRIIEIKAPLLGDVVLKRGANMEKLTRRSAEKRAREQSKAEEVVKEAEKEVKEAEEVVKQAEEKSGVEEEKAEVERKRAEEKAKRAAEARKAEEEKAKRAAEARKAEEEKAKVKRAVEGTVVSDRVRIQEEIREKFRRKIKAWASEGYNVEPLEKVINNDVGTLDSSFKKFEFDVKILQRIEKQLGSYDTAGLEDLVGKIKSKLKDTRKIVELMGDMEKLEKKARSRKAPSKPSKEKHDKKEKPAGKEEKPKEKPPEKKEKPPEKKPEEKLKKVEKPEKKPAEKKKEEKPEEKPPEKKVSKKEALAQLLRDLEVSAKDIKGVAVITKNGLPVSMRLPRDLDVEAFAGMSAAFYGAAETTMLELRHSDLYWVYTETDDSTLVVVNAGKMSLVVALVKAGANIGLVLMKLKGAADKIKGIM